MGGMEAVIPTALGLAGPLITSGKDPNQPFMTPPPGAGQQMTPPGMGIQSQPQQDPSQQMFQMLMALMQHLKEPGAPGAINPMDQAMANGPQPGAPLQGPSHPQSMGVR